MDFLKSFTKKNIARNKKRTIVTIIGVMLSAALICTVAGMAASLVKSLQQNAIETEGNYHATFYNVPEKALSYVENNVHVEKSGTVRDLGFTMIPGVSSKSLSCVEMIGLDRGAEEMIATNLVSGRLPEKSDELLISTDLIEAGGCELKEGDRITLEVGDRMWNGIKLTADIPYITENNAADVMDYAADALGEKFAGALKQAEVFAQRETKTYTVVGIMKGSRIGITRRYSLFLSAYTFSDEAMTGEDGHADVCVFFDKPKETDRYMDEIGETLMNLAEEGEIPDFGGYSKSELARFSGGLSDTYAETILRIVLVIVLVIVVTSVFVISNSFRISVSEKVGQYGMLSSIGATKKQIRRTVMIEGLYIGVIGTVSGILLSLLVMRILVGIVNYLTGDIIDLKFCFAFPWWVAIFTAAMTALTIFFSCVLPARSAAKISPIEAINGSKEVFEKLRAKRLKTSGLTRRLFGIGGVIASKSLKRSRRKYRTTVVSLVLGIAVFVGLSSFVDLGYGLVNTEYKDITYDIIVHESYRDQSASSESGLAATKEKYKKIAELPDVDRLCYYGEAVFEVPQEKYASDEYGACLDSYYAHSPEADLEKNIYIGLIILQRDDFREYAKSLGVKDADPRETVILSDNFVTMIDGKNKRLRATKLSEGDEICGEVMAYDSEGSEQASFTVTKVTEKRPMGYEAVSEDGGFIFVSEDYFEELPSHVIGSAYLTSTHPDQAAIAISKLTTEDPDMNNLYVINLAKQADQMKRMLIMVSIFLYGFVVVIILIGVTNVINTITTNMNLRAREFAMLKSVGMTGREFNRMIRLESLMYGSKSLLIGAPLGILISYLLNRAFANSYVVGYHIPFGAILISAVFVALIVGFTMHYALGKINRQNMIEVIRKQTL